MLDTAHIDIVGPEYKADPYSIYARLRAEAPVCRVRLGGYARVWLITRYDDVLAALKDERLARDLRNAPTSGMRLSEAWVLRLYGVAVWLFRAFMQNMLVRDEPDHTRLRALVHKAFTPRLVENLRSRIETLTEQFLDRVAGNGRMDVIRDYALPLPSTIIAEMLGVPPSDRDRFLRWSTAVIDLRMRGSDFSEGCSERIRVHSLHP